MRRIVLAIVRLAVYTSKYCGISFLPVCKFYSGSVMCFSYSYFIKGAPVQTNNILLPFANTCVQGIFIRRVKRFSVLCIVNGQEVWAHTNNSGSMLGLTREGSKVLLSLAANPNRKLAYTLELIDINNANYYNRSSALHGIAKGNYPQAVAKANAPDVAPVWVGVNTLTPNKLLKAAFEANQLPWAAGYTKFTPEAKRGASRLDALLEGEGLPPLWVECKNVTLVEDGVAAFPDAVTERGQKHQREMMDIIKENERAAFFYCIQRPDATCFAPAGYIDIKYAQLFYESLACGVEAYPYTVPVSPYGIGLGGLLPLSAKPV